MILDKRLLEFECRREESDKEEETVCKQTRPPAQHSQTYYSDSNLYPVYTFSPSLIHCIPCGHCWSSAHLGAEHRQVGQLLSSGALDQMRLYFHGPFAKQNFAI